MKTTPFTGLHIALGAKMHEFAGFNMPIEYSGIINEHLTVVSGVGVFDVSHMGEFWVTGAQALPFIQSVTSNDAAALTPGRIQYSCFPNAFGGIVDDLLVYCFDSDHYLLVVNAANLEKDWSWCVAHNSIGAELINVSDDTAQLAVQGAKAIDVLQRLTSVDLSAIPYYHFSTGAFAGVPNVVLSHTGYTGAGGFELYFPPEQGVTIWNAIFETGSPEGIKPIGLGARDTLRLEAGFCLYGNDLNEATSPLEAGLGWITKFVDGKNFTNRDVLERQRKDGVRRKLCGFRLLDKGVPRHGYDILDANGTVIGKVTSGTMSPCLRVGIGMGYVPSAYAVAGTEIYISVRSKSLKAEVVKLPFRAKSGA